MGCHFSRTKEGTIIEKSEEKNRTIEAKYQNTF